MVPYEYDEHECNTVMVLDHDKLFCVSVGERASSVDDINSMTQIPEEKKEIDKVWFRLNPLTEQNCEKEKKRNKHETTVSYTSVIIISIY